MEGLSAWREVVVDYSPNHGPDVGTGHGDLSCYSAAVYDQQTTVILYQTIDLIPAGTTVDCFAWAVTNRPDNGLSYFSLKLQSRPGPFGFEDCGDVNSPKTWTRLGKRIVLTKDVTEIVFEGRAVSDTGLDTFMRYDDVSVVPVSGPGVKQCSSALSSPSSTTLLASSSASVSSSVVSAAISASSTALVAISSTTSLPTSSSPPPTVCSPSPNYLANGRFTSGLTGWTELGNLQSSDVAPQGGQDGAQYYRFTVKPNQISGSRLVQTVQIPSGTVISCSAYSIIQVEDELVKDFTMLIDGKPCASVAYRNEGQWYRLVGGDVMVSGDEHKVELVMTNVSSSGFAHVSYLLTSSLQPSQPYSLEFGWDDAVVKFVSCPANAVSSPGSPQTLAASV